jgi:hypothetical protein
MPQFNYEHQRWSLGQIASGNPLTINSYLNALLAQESVVTVGGTDAGDYTIRIVGEEGTFDVTYTHPGAGAIGDITAGLQAAIDADPDLVNIVVAVDSDPDVDLNFIHPGKTYTVSFPSNPSGNMTLATAQAPGGPAIELATVVVAASPAGVSTGAQHVTAPGAGSTDADFLGITVKAEIDIQVNNGDPTAETAFEAGTTVSVMEEGECIVEVEDAVAFNGQVFVRIANPAPGQKLGGLRSDAAGGDAVLMTGAKFRSATSGNGLAKVAINRP